MKYENHGFPDEQKNCQKPPKHTIPNCKQGPVSLIDCSWYERKKSKRLPQPLGLGLLQILQRIVTEDMNNGLNKILDSPPHVVMSCNMCWLLDVLSTLSSLTLNRSLSKVIKIKDKLSCCVREMEKLIKDMEAEIRLYLRRNTLWDYASYCGVLLNTALGHHLMCRLGHAIQTLETEFQLTFNVDHLQLPCGWKFGDLEEFRLMVLVTESDSEDWSDFVTLLKEWVNVKVTPWDQSSVVYQYHRARFQHDFLSTKLEEFSGRPAFA